MIQQGTDWGFVGQAYQAPMLLQDTQTCINWYVEVSEDEKSKMPTALLGCPGLNTILSSGVLGPVRGCWVLPGGTSALVVIAQNAYVVKVTVPATQTSSPQFSLTQVGTLKTNSGPVSIRDNGPQFGGQGGYAVIVDGQYGYYYVLTGSTQIVSFTGGVTSGQSTITVSAIPNGLVVGAATTISDSLGLIPGGALFTGANFNSVALNMSALATGTNASDTITVTIPAFGQITDPAFLASSRVAFIEGWLIFNQVGTRTFFTNAATPYTLLFAGSFYSLKDSSTDNLVTLQENNRELWLMGERTSEVWYNAGGANFAFSRIPAVGPQIGCAAPQSLTRMGPDLIWLAKNEQGENIVARSAQYSWERMSTHAIEHQIASYPVVSDAIGYAYEEDGHYFYVLTFPTADVTWVLDGKTRMWHQRASYTNGVYHRHFSNCYMDFANVRVVGDYQNGSLYQMSRQFYSDAGAPLRCQRRAPHLWEKSSRLRLFFGRLQLEFTPGVGLQVGQGSNPQAMLRWSDDGGFTWSSEHWATIGAAGQTRNRAAWNRLGHAWDRIFEVNYSDPTARDIIGATLFLEGEEEAA